MFNLVLVLQQSFEILNSRLVLAKKGNNTSLFRFESGKFPVTRVIKTLLFVLFSVFFFYAFFLNLILGVVEVQWVVIILLYF